MSDASLSKKPLVLHSKTEIFSPPHDYLDGKQVFFTLPPGWAAEDGLYDSEESIRAYGSAEGWVKYWPKIGISWEISHHGVGLEFDLLLEGLGRNPKFRCWRPVDVKGRHGLSGYRGVPGFKEKDHDNYYFVLAVPAHISPNPRREIYCGVRYPTLHRGEVFPVMNALVHSCRIK